MRTVHRTLLVLALAAAPALFAVPAVADAPVDQGWWTVTNQTSALPVPLPEPPVPVPSDVPPDGLLVQGGPQTPTAYAGLIYDVEPGLSLDKLVLKVAPTSATTPNATLQLCPLKTPYLKTERGGPMADAPAYDCTSSAKAAPGADGSTYTFVVSKLADGGTLAVAVLPTAPTDRVVLSKPGPESLRTAGTASQAAPTFPEAPSPANPPPAPAQPAPLPGVQAMPLQQPPAASGPGPSVAGPMVPAQQPPVPATLAASRPDGSSRSLRTILLVTAVGLAATLWRIAGREPEEEPSAA